MSSLPRGAPGPDGEFFLILLFIMTLYNQTEMLPEWHTSCVAYRNVRQPVAYATDT
jgi:hypothetical protein